MRKKIVILIIFLAIIGALYLSESSPILSKSTDYKESTPVNTTNSKVSTTIEVPNNSQQQKKIEKFGKLSPEEEEKLRLDNFEGYLHYKSRIDGKRDSDLIGLNQEEREQTVKARVKEKLLKKLNERAEKSNTDSTKKEDSR